MMHLLQQWRLKRISLVKLRMTDAQALAEVHKSCFTKNWDSSEFESLLSQNSNCSYGVRISKHLLAFLLMRFAADEAEVLTLAVKPAWRNCGLGQRLMKHGFNQARAMGVRQCHLEVESSNKEALSLYQKLGFRETGRRGKYYSSSEGDAVMMTAEID